MKDIGTTGVDRPGTNDSVVGGADDSDREGADISDGGLEIELCTHFYLQGQFFGETSFSDCGITR